MIQRSFHSWAYIWIEWASLMAQTVKNLPAMQETQVWSLGQKVLLEEEMAAHCSTLAWRIPWTEELGGPQSMGLQRVRHDWATHNFTSIRTWQDNVGDFTGGAVVKESTRQCRRLETWVCSLDHSFDYMGLFLNTKSNKCLLGWPPQISSSMGQPRIYRPPIPSSVSPSLKETQLITHIPFLVNLKLRMKNHHAGNCALGDKEVCELLLLNTLKLS